MPVGPGVSQFLGAVTFRGSDFLQARSRHLHLQARSRHLQGISVRGGRRVRRPRSGA